MCLRRARRWEVEAAVLQPACGAGNRLHGVLIMPQRQAITTDLLLSVGGDGNLFIRSNWWRGAVPKILGVNTEFGLSCATVRPSELLGVLEWVKKALPRWSNAQCSRFPS